MLTNNINSIILKSSTTTKGDFQMKKYIGTVSDYNGGTVRMMDSEKRLQPHVLGGANSEGDITFLSYEENDINPEFLRKNNLRFLSKQEVTAFMRGENLKGEKIKKPESPKFTNEQKKEIKRTVLEAIKELEQKGESTDFLRDVLKNLGTVA